jgi:hypothetical protein
LWPFELRASYLDRALMVGHHCRNEIAIDVACWTDQSKVGAGFQAQL